MADPVPYSRDDPSVAAADEICRFQSLGGARAVAQTDPRAPIP